MLARIKLKHARVHKDEVKLIADFLGEDDVKVEDAILDDDGRYRKFYSWDNTYDPEEADKKKLVKRSDYKFLDTNMEYITNVTEFMSAFPTIQLELRGIPKVSVPLETDLMNKLKTVEDKISTMFERFDKTVEFNEKCEVHIPNFNLMNINKVEVVNDYCTEELQDRIEEGWRLLAICPQPDQRRPDYILGRCV